LGADAHEDDPCRGVHVQGAMMALERADALLGVQPAFFDIGGEGRRLLGREPREPLEILDRTRHFAEPVVGQAEVVEELPTLFVPETRHGLFPDRRRPEIVAFVEQLLPEGERRLFRARRHAPGLLSSRRRRA
jgi:hypothetical protein